jgi:putative peptidoglycan lipid II flippase
VSRQFFKSTAVVSGLTLVSRILGFIRDMLIARIFGADSGTDAFFIVFKIPNFFRRLFAEGAFAQAFVPALIDYERQGCKPALQDFIDRAGGTLAALLMLASIIGMLAAPILIVVFAPGFLREGAQFELSVQMLRITMPYLFFIASVAFAGSILNAHGRFAVPAVTPVLLNICMIVAAVWIAPLLAEPILALAWGVLVAGIVQLLFQFPALKRLGLVPRLQLGLSDPAVMRTLKMMGPAVFAVSVTQVNLLLDTFMASFLKTGSISWLYYSDRLVEFPLGILGVALATVILPKLSRDHVAEDAAAFSRALDWGLRWVLLLGMPASVGLALLAEPVLFALFQYGEFTAVDVGLAGRSLMGYASGLMGFMLIKVLATGFSARKDLATPVRFGVYSLFANMILNMVLILPLAHAGLALATSLAAFINAGLLLLKLVKDQVYRPGPGWPVFALRIGLANVVMALTLHGLVKPSNWQGWHSADRVIYLALSIALGGAVYLAMLGLMGLKPRHLAV